ncbi:hypothetical protein VTK73DRAFT_10212 [Phialemonium thermophilum]|uniref:MIP18 family-like domain-containing protein n=1 Tax=Phialemonium thermophilum TaxID=223376 RepID=A0ABR3VXZ4_9PEZI
MASLDNANPFVVDLSHLPTRRRKPDAVARFPESKYDDILFPKQDDLWRPFRSVSPSSSEGEDDEQELQEEPIDELEIFDLLSTISDPEHPQTLGQLSVVNLPDIHIRPKGRPDPRSLVTVTVELTPTVNHCSLATIIGLAVRVRLEQTLPPNYRVDVRMKQGSHAQDDQVNKQLADKERVAAALENATLKQTLDEMLRSCL